MNVLGPGLIPVVEIKRLSLDDVEAIKINLKANHDIPEFKYSPVTIPPKLNEEPQQSRGRVRSVESSQQWRSHSEDSSTKYTGGYQKWEHQLKIQGITSLLSESQTIWQPPSCTSSPAPSMVFDSDVSVKEEMDIEDHRVYVGDCASLADFSFDPPEQAECFVQTEYPCYKCHMVYSKSNLLLHHLKTHRTSSVFSPKRSSLFSQSTPPRRSALNCIDLMLSKKLKYRCKNCGRGFSRPNYLELHLRAFFRNRTCDKMVFPRKNYKSPSRVQSEQRIGSVSNSNLLVSDHMKYNPVEDQNFVRAMMHVAATAEDCFNLGKSEHHKDEVGNSRQTRKKTTVNDNVAPSICERSGSTIGNISKVSGRACEAQSAPGIAANLDSQSIRIGGRVICNVCSRRFKGVHHLKLHYRAHYKIRNTNSTNKGPPLLESEIHNTAAKGNLTSMNSTNKVVPLLESEIRDTAGKGNSTSTNSTNEVPPLPESVNDESVFPSACQVCEKHYKDTHLLKKHEMTRSVKASRVSNCSNISSETNPENAREGGSNISGNSTGRKKQPLESQKNLKKNCSEVREESTVTPSISKWNVQSGDDPSNTKELDVSQGSSNAKEFSCYVCLEKLKLVTKPLVVDDLKSVVKSDYGKEGHVKKSTESEKNVKKARMSNNSDSCVIDGKTRQTSQNISYSKTGSNSKKVKEECSESCESSSVSLASGYKKRYRCRVCKRKVSTLRKDYEQHRILECNASVNSCPFCGAKFYKKGFLVAHVSRHFKFRNGVRTILNRAVRGAFSKNKKRNNIRKSSIFIRSKPSLLQHDVPSNKNSGIVLHHLKKKQKKPIYLSSQKQDQRMLNYSGKLVSRKLRHTNSCVRKLENLRIRNCKTVIQAEKTEKCAVCNKSFGSLKALKLHKRVHTSNVKRQCFMCEKKFDMFLDLYMHVRTHSKKVKPCKFCGKEFPNLSSLLSHCSVHKKV
ncbi:zinc finger protein 107 [Anabrus simplex]|uniref:zinc finger protein 107 n=1 Tax=Anabrus simplex TaxID=316456 RepID=UPI0035A2A5A3